MLTKLLVEYSVSRGLRPSSVAYFRRCVQQFEKHLGRAASIDDLTDYQISAFLAAKADRAPAYRKSLRTGLIALARYAADEGDKEPPRRVAPVRVPRTPPEAWSGAEVQRLRRHAERLSGTFRGTSIPRGRYFETLITAAWYLGLSEIDLRRLRPSDFVGGRLVTTRSKTGHRVAVSLPTDEWERLLTYLSISCHTGGPIWPLWGSREIFRRTFGEIVAKAKLTGSFKKLRISAGTAYEVAHPGLGHQFLANTRDVFLRSYYDPRQEQAELPHAPRLA